MIDKPAENARTSADLRGRRYSLDRGRLARIRSFWFTFHVRAAADDGSGRALAGRWPGELLQLRDLSVGRLGASGITVTRQRGRSFGCYSTCGAGELRRGRIAPEPGGPGRGEQEPEDHVAEQPLFLDLRPDCLQQAGGFPGPSGITAGENHFGRPELGHPDVPDLPAGLCAHIRSVSRSARSASARRPSPARLPPSCSIAILALKSSVKLVTRAPEQAPSGLAGPRAGRAEQVRRLDPDVLRTVVPAGPPVAAGCRAVMVPLSLHGLAASRIAELLECYPATVRRWRGVFVSLDAPAGVAGVAEAGQRRGRHAGTRSRRPALAPQRHLAIRPAAICLL